MTDAREKVSLPATLLLVAAGIGMVLACANGLFSIIGLMAGSAVKVADPNVPKDQQAAFDFANRLGGVTGVSFAIVGMVGGAVIVFGALKMKNLQMYGLALTATIVAMVPGVSPCCCLTLPVGIWALIVLLNQDVKSAFQ